MKFLTFIHTTKEILLKAGFQLVAVEDFYLTFCEQIRNIDNLDPSYLEAHL
jgi:hypothetical protein